MRAAQLQENVVINFAEVGGFGGQFIDPKDSVLGSVFDPETETFTHPPPATEE